MIISKLFFSISRQPLRLTKSSLLLSPSNSAFFGSIYFQPQIITSRIYERNILSYFPAFARKMSYNPQEIFEIYDSKFNKIGTAPRAQVHKKVIEKTLIFKITFLGYRAIIMHRLLFCFLIRQMSCWFKNELHQKMCVQIVGICRYVFWWFEWLTIYGGEDSRTFTTWRKFCWCCCSWSSRRIKCGSG